MAWWTVQATVNAAAVLLPNVDDPAWAHWTLLLRGYDTLSERGRIGWRGCSPPTTPPMSCQPPGVVKEQLRRLLASASVETARTEKMILGCHVLAADMEESWRFWTRSRPGGRRSRC